MNILLIIGGCGEKDVEKALVPAQGFQALSLQLPEQFPYVLRL